MKRSKPYRRGPFAHKIAVQNAKQGLGHLARMREIDTWDSALRHLADGRADLAVQAFTYAAHWANRIIVNR